MANYQTLIAEIQENIKTNGNNEITGSLLQQVLISMITNLGNNYQFAGVAEPSTSPGSPDQNVFYLASEPGAYPNFGLTIPASGLYAFLWNGTWTMVQVTPMSNDLDIGVVNENGLFLVDQSLNVGVRVDSDGLNANNLVTIELL